MRLQRIKPPYQIPKEKKRKTLGVKQENSNETQAIKQKARKLVQKAKGNKITKEKKSNTQRNKGKLILDDSVLPLPAVGTTQVSMALVDEELVIVDEIGKNSDTARQTKKKKKTKLMSLKPPPPQAPKNIKGKKITKAGKVSKKKDDSSADGEVSSVRKSSRQAARKVKEVLMQQIDVIDLEESEKKSKKSSKKDKTTKGNHSA